ncbi:iron-sulfur cluster assembly accessory protein [Chloroherpeton thalassium ATCC 35110]|uniref:Iron-sulfur cluster assembly accessory protein n=1 Tax=Chloroherpeton thalassium (strain ATCC 35110 / GB-78) TaxID=517418 RepID=B3QXG4_CHLT3|nr:iron-sulfur cluster assembly accessory protein [Chloroherpeton thalassium]ACF13438.1 iron-sulfur cluster assembly accessory protein [Chloroherpeton thalassium ATCC 35110]
MSESSVQENQSTKNSAPITITDAAASEIRQVAEANKVPEGYTLRVALSSGGCSGFSYAMGFDQTRDGDHHFSINGVDLIIASQHLQQLAGTTIDFKDSPEGRGFLFDNPNIQHTCGCGSSSSCH